MTKSRSFASLDPRDLDQGRTGHVHCMGSLVLHSPHAARAIASTLLMGVGAGWPARQWLHARLATCVCALVAAGLLTCYDAGRGGWVTVTDELTNELISQLCARGAVTVPASRPPHQLRQDVDAWLASVLLAMGAE